MIHRSCMHLRAIVLLRRVCISVADATVRTSYKVRRRWSTIRPVSGEPIGGKYDFVLRKSTATPQPVFFCTEIRRFNHDAPARSYEQESIVRYPSQIAVTGRTRLWRHLSAHAPQKYVNVRVCACACVRLCICIGRSLSRHGDGWN
jgi:hypothetical protein